MVKIPFIAEKLKSCPDEDHSIEIPDQGNLFASIDLPSSKLSKLTKPEIIQFGGHYNRFEPDLQKFETVQIIDSDDVYDTYLMWIPKRKEWVGVGYRLLDSHFEGELSGIEEELIAKGPFSLGKGYAQLIQNAYLSSVSLDKILHTPPEHLKSLTG